MVGRRSVASTEKAKRRLSAISSGKLRKLELSPPPESDDDDDDETRAESQARPPTEVLEPEPPIESWDDAQQPNPTALLTKPTFGSPPAAEAERRPSSRRRRRRRRRRRALLVGVLLWAGALGVYAARPAWIPPGVYAQLDPLRDQALARYDAWGEKNMYGKISEGVIRSTVLIDPKGKVVKHWRRVKAKGHAQAVHKVLKEINAETST